MKDKKKTIESTFKTFVVFIMALSLWCNGIVAIISWNAFWGMIMIFILAFLSAVLGLMIIAIYLTD